jgi:hypothetical protein
MENKNTPAGGRPGRGKSGESNRPYNTTLWSRLQAVEGRLLPLIVIVERVAREVTR